MQHTEESKSHGQSVKIIFFSFSRVFPFIFIQSEKDKNLGLCIGREKRYEISTAPIYRGNIDCVKRQGGAAVPDFAALCP